MLKYETPLQRLDASMEGLASEWSARVAECAKQYGDKKAKLWRFEVKRLINSSNVRSAFFQAVSNSSWAI